MIEFKGHLLTEEEEKAFVGLLQKMRQRKVFVIDFSGCIRVKAKTREEANNIFWDWVKDLQELDGWSEVITQSHYFENECVEEE